MPKKPKWKDPFVKWYDKEAMKLDIPFIGLVDHDEQEADKVSTILIAQMTWDQFFSDKYPKRYKENAFDKQARVMREAKTPFEAYRHVLDINAHCVRNARIITIFWDVESNGGSKQISFGIDDATLSAILRGMEDERKYMKGELK